MRASMVPSSLVSCEKGIWPHWRWEEESPSPPRLFFISSLTEVAQRRTGAGKQREETEIVLGGGTFLLLCCWWSEPKVNRFKERKSIKTVQKVLIFLFNILSSLWGHMHANDCSRGNRSPCLEGKLGMMISFSYSQVLNQPSSNVR